MPHEETALVSILLPIYNGERYLAHAIDSALGQTYENIELIVVDDCSTDRSLVIAREYAERDARVRIFENQANMGLFPNYNRCLDLSRGEFVKPFAQDDLLEPQAIERMVQAFADQPSVGLVSCAKRWISENGETLQEFRLFPGNTVVPGHEVILYNLIQLSNWVGEPSTVMYRKKFAGSGFDSDFYHYGDIEYWFRVLECSDYQFISNTLCSFRRHPGSCSTRNLHGMYFGLDMFRLIKKYEHVLEEFGEDKQNTMKRTIERMALNLDHLVRNEGVTAEEVKRLTGSAKDDEQAHITADFAEIAFHSLQYLTQLLSEMDHLRRTRADEHDLWQGEMRKLLNSPSWKVTAPLRAIKQVFRSAGVIGTDEGSATAAKSSQHSSTLNATKLP